MWMDTRSWSRCVAPDPEPSGADEALGRPAAASSSTRARNSPWLRLPGGAQAAILAARSIRRPLSAEYSGYRSACDAAWGGGQFLPDRPPPCCCWGPPSLWSANLSTLEEGHSRSTSCGSLSNWAAMTASLLMITASRVSTGRPVRSDAARERSRNVMSSLPTKLVSWPAWRAAGCPRARGACPSRSAG